MNKLINKLAVLLGGLLLLSPLCLLAHEKSGTLPKLSSATHYYRIDCDTGSAFLYLTITGKGSATAPLVSAQMSKDSIAMSTTDSKNTDAISSRAIKMTENDGSYHVTINKSKSGAVNYGIKYHCMDNNGNHTDTSATAVEYKR